MSHIHDHVGTALTKASVGVGSATSFLGFKGWIEQNSIVIGVCLTAMFGVIGVYIQWKNYMLNKRRVETDRLVRLEQARAKAKAQSKE